MATRCHQARPLRVLAARRRHAAHGRAQGLRRASPRPCVWTCPARWKRAATRSSAGTSPIPTRRWWRSSSLNLRVLPRRRARGRAQSRRHSRRARPAVAQADALGGGLLHGLDPHLGADQGGAQAAQGRIRRHRQARPARSARPSASTCAARSWRRAMRRSPRACSRRCARTTSPPRCCEPHEALRVARAAMYREMSGSEWRPMPARRPGDGALSRGRRARSRRRSICCGRRCATRSSTPMP